MHYDNSNRTMALFLKKSLTMHIMNMVLVIVN
nr:MAG TPA: hypothetical protein [Caudoviricetes sp.]